MLVARAALLAGDVEPSRGGCGRGGGPVRGTGTRRLVGGCVVAACRGSSTTPAPPTNPTPLVIDTVIAATEDAGLSAASAVRPCARRRVGRQARRRESRRTPPRCGGARARLRHPLPPRPRRRPATRRSGRPEDALRRCAETVDEFASLTSALGGTELRAHVAMHVAAVVDLGVALSVRSGDAELAFAWSERQRASALATVPVRPPEEAALAQDLDHLRAAITEHDSKIRDGVSDPHLARPVRPTAGQRSPTNTPRGRRARRGAVRRNPAGHLEGGRRRVDLVRRGRR